MSTTRIPAAEVMSEAFSTLWREKGLLLLLTGFVSVLYLIWLWPVLETYTGFIQTAFAGQQISPDVLAEELSSYLVYFFLFLIPMLAVQYGTYTLWSRASILGHARAMEGGFKALVHRTLWVFWRNLCGMGWMFLMMIGLMIIVFGVFAIAGVSLSGSNPSSGGVLGALAFLLIFPLYIVFFIAMYGLMVLIALSTNAEARDIRLSIHKSYELMKGNILRAGGLLILILIFFEMGISMFFFGAVFSGGSENLLAPILGFVAMFFGLTLFYFLWISYGAIYAQMLVPELKDPIP